MGEEFEVYAVYAEEIAAFFFSFACSICGCETYPTSHEFPNSCPQPRSRTGELIGRGIPSIFSGASDESLKAVDLGAQSSFPQRQRFAASGSDLNLSAGAKSEKKEVRQTACILSHHLVRRFTGPPSLLFAFAPTAVRNQFS